MDKINMKEISNMGTINGIKKLGEIMGENHIYPRISFYALDFGMFSPEDSHFVLYNAVVKHENQKISFINEKRIVDIEYTNPLQGSYFNGSKTGYINHQGKKNAYIEFTTEEYFVEIALG